MLPNFIRQRIPEEVREKLSIALLSQMGKFRWTYWIYSQILCDGYPSGVDFLPDWEFGYTYQGHYIIVPRDGGIVIRETFQENLYWKLSPPEGGDVVLDIGAYVGTFTLKASLAVGKAGTIVAVEPNPRNMDYCHRNCQQLDNVRYVEKAISNASGKAKLYLSDGSPCHTLVYPHGKSTRVHTTTIDELVKELELPKVDLIKMDIEGANLMALEGAKETLKRPEVKLAIAAYHKQPNGKPEMPDIIKFLRKREFTIYEERGYVYAKK